MNDELLKRLLTELDAMLHDHRFCRVGSTESDCDCLGIERTEMLENIIKDARVQGLLT